MAKKEATQPWVGKETGWPHWVTPIAELETIQKIAPIRLDPCSNIYSHVHRVSPGVLEWMIGPSWEESKGKPGDDTRKLRRIEQRDGLASPWTGISDVVKPLVFVNNPYNDMKRWAEKLIEEGNRGVQIFALLPAKTDTLWFHSLIRSCNYACLRKGRISFDNPPPTAKGPAPAGATVYLYWGEHGDRFVDLYDSKGEVMQCEQEIRRAA